MASFPTSLFHIITYLLLLFPGDSEEDLLLHYRLWSEGLYCMFQLDQHPLKSCSMITGSSNRISGQFIRGKSPHSSPSLDPGSTVCRHRASGNPGLRNEVPGQFLETGSHVYTSPKTAHMKI